MIKVCHIGPGEENPGGMLTVINDYKNNKTLQKQYEFFHIVSVAKKHKLLRWFLSTIQFILLHFKHRFDIVHLHMSEYGSCYRKILFLKISKFFNIKVIVHSHGGNIETHYFGLNNNQKMKFAKVMNQADAIVILTDGWKKFWNKIVDVNKLVVVPNFVSMGDKYNDSKSYFKDGVLNLLFLGHISNQKGIYDLLEVIKKLNESGHENIKLRVGGNGEIEKLSHLVIEYQLESIVDVVGWADERKKIELLKISDVLLLPSYFESFGIVVLEAMKYKLPVIVGDGGYTKELVDEGVDGFVVESGNVEQIANRILGFINNSNIKTMGLLGYKKVESQYSDIVIVDKIKELYERLLK